MKKILLIEDDKIVRENTAEILELAHYKVATAENGKKGILLVKEFCPDLIVCDIMMPELDGYGVLHIVSKDPATASIPFIFLTAKAEKSELRKGMELGADDYLTKPFEETELLKIIETRLAKSERLKKQFAQNIDGLNQFFNEAGSLQKLGKLSLKKPLVKFKKKEIIFREGDSPQHLFFLAKGKVKIFKAHNEGKEYVTELLKEGDFFGYIPLFKNSFYSDSAMAFEDCEVCKIPKEDFIAIVTENRDLSTQFIKMLSNHVSEIEKQLLSLAYDTVRKRVAVALLLLAKRFPDTVKKHSQITINREDLSDLAGTATETVIRCLSEYKADKLIDIEGHRITLLNPQGLENIR